MQIKGTTVVVTGGASGMGAATAAHLSYLGANVFIVDKKNPSPDVLAACSNSHVYACDITQTDALQQSISEINQHHDPIRIWINCAGIIHSRRMVNREGPMPLEEFRQVIDINLIGTFNAMRLAANAIIPLVPVPSTGERGVIINTASIAGFEGQIGQTAYSASKNGVIGLTLPAARELGQFGIRVMTIAPGLVDTAMLGQLSLETKNALTENIVFPKRLAFPKEYAHLVQHIIENSMLNGEVIRLDGGLRLTAK